MNKSLLRFFVLLSLPGAAVFGQTVLYTPSGTVSTSGTGNVGVGVSSPSALFTVGAVGTADNGTAQFNIDPTSFTISSGGTVLTQSVIQAFTNTSTSGSSPTNALMLSHQITYNGTTLASNGLWVDVSDPDSNTGALGTMRGAEINVSHYGSANASILMGQANLVTNVSSATQAIGVRSAISNTAVGETSASISGNTFGFEAALTNSGSSNTMGTYRGLSVDSISNSGTITNTYGVYVGTMTAGTQTNHPFSFYASDTSAWNYFGGAVGIGTTNIGSYLLAVGGSIHAYDVVVDTGWADYVFAPNYKLQDLGQVERAIKQDGHLPGIPSAREVAEHGVNVGQMEAKLLAKVEELTLYMIDLKKENAELRTEVENLKMQAK